jgi:hypothetical protein
MTTSKKFRFVSPGIYISEIDKSQIPSVPTQIGPVVIGRSQRGPILIPTRVDSYLDFIDKFGEPTRGVSNEDVWRTNQPTAPLYAAYAAKAFLKNSGPLTFVRLGIDKSPDNTVATPLAAGGWNTDAALSTTLASTNGGAYGLFVVPSGSSNLTGTLAAVWYLNSGAIRLRGNAPNGVTVGNSGAGVLVQNTGAEYEFRAEILNSAGTTVLDTTFNLNEASSKYARKVFNTNPTLTTAATTPSEVLETYWLGETHETFLRDTVTGSTSVFGFIAPVQNSTIQLNDFTGKTSAAAKTGWVVAQDLSTVTGSYTPTAMHKLFRFVVKEAAGGEWEQRNIKISISDIKPSTNNFYNFGSFTVQIRDIRDTDANPNVLETFTNCTLDPDSADFIANKIGDQEMVWDTINKRYITNGDYSNKSAYIRVEMNDMVAQGAIPQVSLPFGFFGPPVFNDIVVTSGSAISATSLMLGSGSTTGMPFALSASVANSIAMPGIAASTSYLIKFPTMKLRVSASDAGVLDPSDAYFGTVFNKFGSTRLNDDMLDLTRPKPADIDSIVADTTNTKPSFVFSLDDVVAVSGSTKLSLWVSGARAGGTSITALSASASGSNEGYKSVLNFGADRFTLPLFGGTDGMNVREKDPFRNTLLSSPATEAGNAAFYSLKKAIDTVKDPDVIDMNMLVVPGITNSAITKHVIDTSENRADTLAIIDLEGGYVPAHESTTSENARRGSVDITVNALRDRTLNSSYACAYYPWVKVLDEASGLPLWMPPSVAALGTMGSSQESSELWFAPAGFNRGGLTDGSAGLSVIDVREKLSSKQRDKLYENNINPIASFPNEGIVIFGQKTLQVTPSALDRINVRRLMIYLKKEISRLSTRVLFDQNIKVTWDRFKGDVVPFLASVQSRFGLTDYKVLLDETTTTPDLVDRNIMYAKIFVKPARSIEFIAIDFVITRSGASFND